MKSKRSCFNLPDVEIFSFLIVVIIMLMAIPAQAEEDCKFLIKNKGPHRLQVSATLGTIQGRVPLPDSGDIHSGYSGIIRVPCHALDVEVTVTDGVRGESTTLSKRGNFTSECIVLRYPPLTLSRYVHCPVPGVPESNCYKYVTFKNEASYIANALAYYVFKGQDWENETDNITSLQTKKLSIPCDASEVRVVTGIPGRYSFLRQTYATPSDDCFILIGNDNSANHEKYTQKQSIISASKIMVPIPLI